MRLIEKYLKLKTDEERNKYYSELSPEDKEVLNNEYASLDPFGFDADIRWDEVNDLVGSIISAYSSTSFTKYDTDMPQELWVWLREMRNHHFQKQGIEFEQGIQKLKDELSKIRKIIEEGKSNAQL
jgi:hypothetical protein